MSLLTDLRAVSGNALEQLAARFSDLPTPLLAAIGAGDMAVARFADLRESLIDSFSDRVGPPTVDIKDVRSAIANLPARAQQAAVDVATSIESLAADAPARVQELIAQLPDKLAEIQIATQSLSPDEVRRTMDAYGQLAALIYGNLADRGGLAWTRVRTSGLRPGTVVDPAPPGASAAAAAARAAASARAAAAVRAATEKAGPDAEPAEPPVPTSRTEPAAGRRKRAPASASASAPAAAVPEAPVSPSSADPTPTAAQAPAAPAADKPAPVRARAGRARTAGPAGPAAAVVTPDDVTAADVIPKGAVVKPTGSVGSDGTAEGKPTDADGSTQS